MPRTWPVTSPRWPAAAVLPWRHQVIFGEEYARAGGPARIGHIGEQLVAPMLLMFGTAEQRARFLPGIQAGTQLWCQGYSEPGAGSDLAAVATRARLDGDEWHLDGQKVWTSLAAPSVTRSCERGWWRHGPACRCCATRRWPRSGGRPVPFRARRRTSASCSGRGGIHQG